jgi:hypothetical protein
VCAHRSYRDVVIFLSLYLLLSVPAFFYINPRTVARVVDWVYPPDVVGLTTLAILSGLLLYGLVLADQGVNRFNEFLLVPSDVPSVLVVFLFLWAAISWWAAPELLHTLGLGLTLNLYLTVVVASQIPMVLLLSLMTAAGRASA